MVCFQLGSSAHTSWDQPMGCQLARMHYGKVWSRPSDHECAPGCSRTIVLLRMVPPDIAGSLVTQGMSWLR